MPREEWTTMLRPQVFDVVGITKPGSAGQARRCRAAGHCEGGV